jgi:hypothetical protein
MSNALAIAAVTRVLKDLLNNGLVDADVSGAVGGNVSVSALPPDRVLPANGTEASAINLFLHQVTPNPGWRNADLPARGAGGDRITRPLLALDLHYLLTAYGAEELHSEILLGYAMQLLHEHPVLGRQQIRDALAGGAVSGTVLPPAFEALTAADLAEQVELIKITPETLSTDEMSKVWTALQSHYRPTTGYHVSVVLIESRGPSRTPLPVLTRGRRDPVTGREAGVAVQPSLAPPFPTLTAVTPPAQQVAARMGEVVTLEGHHLDGDQVAVRFVEPRSRRVLVLPAQPGGTPARVEVQVPPDPPPGPVTPGSPLDPASWQVAVYHVAVVVSRAGEPDRVSNALPLALAPRRESTLVVAGGGAVMFTVVCRPPVRRTQDASLVVGDREIPAQPIGPAQTDTLTFETTGLASGSTHWVRFRVDGIDSLLIDRSATPPAFFASETVTIP